MINGNPEKLSGRVRGFGLVEIMLALVISLLLMTGVFQVYQGSKQSYDMAENMSRLQENARFGMDMLARDIRMAGFMPCKSATTGDMANTVNGGGGNLFYDFFAGPVQGFEGGVSTFPADLPAAGTGAGQRVADADAIVIRRGGGQSYHVVSHKANSAQFKVNKPHNFEDGQIAMVCDGEHASIFQMTNVNQSNKTIVHNEGTGSPGNCEKHLGGNGDCAGGGFQPFAYSDESQVVVFEAHAYYIGVGSSGDGRSLYRISLVKDGATETQELLDGIENMQIVYGEDGNADGVADRYVTADVIEGAGTWNQVVGVRLGLLVRTPEEISPDPDTRDYNVAGTVIGTASAVQHPEDRRLRHAFNSTIKLRNRGL